MLTIAYFNFYIYILLLPQIPINNIPNNTNIM